MYLKMKAKNYRNFYTEEYFKKNYCKKGVKRNFFTPERKYIERDRDIFRLLELNKKDVVLELGCASGVTSKKISKYVKRVIAIDFSEEAINLAEKENAGENIDYKIADATDLFFLESESVDKVAANDFIEHIDDVDLAKVLKEANRVLKPGGTITIYTPQRLHWAEIIKHFLNTDPTHISVRTPDKIIKMAEKEDFKPDLLYFSPNPYVALRWIDKVLTNIPLINRFFRFRTCLRLRKKVKNIAYMGAHGIGDLIINIPILKKLRNVFPDVMVNYICIKTKYKGFLEDCIYIDSVTELDRSFFKLPFQIMKLRKKRFDLMVMPMATRKPTKVLAKLVGAKSLAICVEDIFSEKNLVDKAFSTLEQIGIQTKQEEKKLEWPFSLNESKSKINKILKENKINKQDLLIGIHAGADKKLAANLWLGKRWAKATEYLIEKSKAKAVFVGGKDDEEHMKEIVNLLKKKKAILNLVNKLSIKETAALIDKCKLFISTNSGPMWIAAALGKPQVVLSGPSLVQSNAYNNKAIVIQKKINRKDCWPPCGSRSNTKCKYKDNLCMKSISVEDVIKAIKNIRRNK